jgi:hypothetical protein
MQTIIKLFKFRNALAHARTETITAAEKRVAAEELHWHSFPPRLLTQWEQLIQDAAFARLARKDVEAVVMLIHDARPEPKDYPFTFGLGIRQTKMESTR